MKGFILKSGHGHYEDFREINLGVFSSKNLAEEASIKFLELRNKYINSKQDVDILSILEDPKNSNMALTNIIDIFTDEQFDRYFDTMQVISYAEDFGKPYIEEVEMDSSFNEEKLFISKSLNP